MDPSTPMTLVGAVYKTRPEAVGGYGDDLELEYPIGSGQRLTLDRIIADLQDRLISLFTRDANGRRACFGGTKKMQTVRRSLRTICRKAGIAEEWMPRELRHTFVSLLSDNGMAIEKISRLIGHSSSNVTETAYRHQIRPVITTGAEAMEKILANER